MPNTLFRKAIKHMSLIGGLFLCLAASQSPSPSALAAAATQSIVHADASEQPAPLVVLLTDFGERGYLLGALKGSVYSHAPGVRVDSISNSIERFDVQEASWTLALAAESFPEGTIFVAVVSPDKSGPRPPIALATRSGHTFLAPDNGLLTQVALRFGVEGLWRLNPEAISNEEIPPFAARDLLGPAAGALARGEALSQIGTPQESLYLLAAPPAELTADHVAGTVTLVDRFGNVFTNIQGAQLKALDLKPGSVLRVTVGDTSFDARWVNTYGDVKLLEPLATLNPWGEIKLALNQGDFAATHAVREGAMVHIAPSS